MDPFRTLGLAPTASDQEIDAAFRHLSAANHPDRFPDDEEKAAAARRLLELQVAYQQIREQRRQSFHFTGQVPNERAWAMQQGAPFRAPPPQTGEDVIVVGEPARPTGAGLTQRPPGWREWWRAVAAAAAGSTPFIAAVAVLVYIVTWAWGGGVHGPGDWALLAVGLLGSAGVALLGALPVWRLWLLLTRLRPGRGPAVSKQP